jgi:transcription initiation factor TFIIIB Brf1 subunit/transcription initiation factor TFIIB
VTSASVLIGDKDRCPECNSTLVSAEGEVVCQGCGLVVGLGEYGPEEEMLLHRGGSDGSRTEEVGSSPDVPYFTGYGGKKLAASDLLVKHLSSKRNLRMYATGDLLAGILSLPTVQISTALMLLGKVKSCSKTRQRMCDLLGGAIIISSRMTDSRRHLTIARMVDALNSIGYRTRPRNVIQALSLFKEQGLYVCCKTPEEHLEDIFSGLDLMLSMRGLSSERMEHEWEVARKSSLKILSLANAHKIVSNPRSRAACSVYAAFNGARSGPNIRKLRVSFSKIAQASGLAEYTVRDNYERWFSGFMFRISA